LNSCADFGSEILAKRAIIYCGHDEISWEEFCDALALFQEYYPEIKESFLDKANRHASNLFGEVNALGASRLVEITNKVFRKSADGSIQSRLMTLENLVGELTMFHTLNPKDTVYAMVALAKDVRTVAQKVHTMDPGAFSVQTPPTEREFDLSPQFDSSSPPPPKRRKTSHNQRAADMWKRGVHGVIAVQNEDDETAYQSSPRRRKGAARLPELVEQVAPRRPKFRVDYNRSFLRVCMDFVAFTILQSGSVDIICRPWVPEGLRQEFGLPSWLIDVEADAFRTKADGTFVRVNGNPLVGHGANQLKWFSACGPFSRAWRIQKYNVDNGWGFGFFDRDSAFTDKRGEHKSLFLNGFVLDAIHEIKTNAEDGTIPSEWFDFGGWKNRAGIPPDEFWRTLVADRDRHGKSAKAYYPRTLRDVVKQHCARGSPMNVKMILAIPQCNRTSEEVLNRLLEVAPNRRLFRLSSDTKRVLGLAPARAQQGDLICILAGCSVPVVLRRHEETISKKPCTYFELLGDSYVHGFMDGDAVTEQERRGIPTQQFELR
jgi:hypothetical protein